MSSKRKVETYLQDFHNISKKTNDLKENIRQYIERLANILPNTENLTKQNYVEFIFYVHEFDIILFC